MSDNTTFYNPYRDSYPSTVRMYNIHEPAPLKGFNDDLELTKNLTLGEVRKTVYILDDEKNLFHQIPIDDRLLQAFQIIRNYLGKPVHLTSSWRSLRWDLNKGRSGEGRHTYGQAFDLKGSGLVALIREAVETKNELYQELRKVGVNGFGIYTKGNFVHIDVRPLKANGDIALFGDDNDELLEIKKKGVTPVLKALGIVAGLALIVVGIFKRFIR